MKKSYSKLIKEVYKRNSKLYELKNEALLTYLYSVLSYLITPLFLILKVKPNTITLINFFISILSLIFITSLDKKLFCAGILLYALFRIIDFCDGNVARCTNNTSFYGRFLDASLDIFNESLLILVISFFCFKQFNNEYFLYIGIISSVLSIYGTCVFDKYASLIRWSNSENKTNFKPYIRKTLFPRIGYTLNDIVNISILSLPFFMNNNTMFKIASLTIFFTFIIFGILNIIKHIFFASKYLTIKAKDKKTYVKKN